MLVLGIDPGTAITGFGLVKELATGLEAVGYGSIRTSSRMAPGQRLQKIYRELEKVLRVYRPDVVAVEELFFNKNVKTALAVGEARGVVLLAAANFGVRVLEYTPPEVKLAVAGYGRSDKDQVGSMVKMLLSLDENPKPDDVADALAVAICCLHSRRLQELQSKSKGGGSRF